MSTDKISISVVENFIQKVRVAAKSNQKTVSIPTNDALDVCFHLNLILLRLLDKDQKNDITNDTVIINMDGGSLEDRR
jgi:hypothetical protein